MDEIDQLEPWITEEMILMKARCPTNEVRALLGKLCHGYVVDDEDFDQAGADRAKEWCRTMILSWIDNNVLPGNFHGRKILQDLINFMTEHNDDVDIIKKMIVWFTGTSPIPDYDST